MDKTQLKYPTEESEGHEIHVTDEELKALITIQEEWSKEWSYKLKLQELEVILEIVRRGTQDYESIQEKTPMECCPLVFIQMFTEQIAPDIIKMGNIHIPKKGIFVPSLTVSRALQTKAIAEYQQKYHKDIKEKENLKEELRVTLLHKPEVIE